MPVLDWTRVDDGVFHDVHHLWIAEIRRALRTLLPSGYDALSEQNLGGGGPDVLSLQRPEMGAEGVSDAEPDSGGGVLVTAPPRSQVYFEAERESYTFEQGRLVIRHKSGHRVVAVIEIVSAGNKSGEYPWNQFLNKALACLHRGVHLLILDLHPPTARDPHGVHAAIWSALTGESYCPPAGANRTLAAYAASTLKRAYVEPLALGQEMPNMPLFLTPDGHVVLPVEETFQAAYSLLDAYYRRILEAPPA